MENYNLLIQDFKSVTLFFENVEDICIPIEYINKLKIGPIHVAPLIFNDESLYWNYMAPNIEIMIDSLADTQPIPFSYDEFIGHDEHLNQSVFERLIQRTDIVGIQLDSITNDDRMVLYVDWSGDCQYFNESVLYQRLDDGQLQLTVKEP